MKTTESEKKVSADFVDNHIKIGIDALKEIKYNRLSVKHLKFGYGD